MKKGGNNSTAFAARSNPAAGLFYFYFPSVEQGRDRFHQQYVIYCYCCGCVVAVSAQQKQSELEQQTMTCDVIATRNR